MSLSKVLEQMTTLLPVANEDVDSGPIETLTGRRGRKRNAQDEIVRLRGEYLNKLLASTVFIVVTGSDQDAFEAIATEKFGCFTSDPESVFKDLANRVAPSLYEGRESLSGLFDVVGRHLEDKANELGIIGYPQLLFKHQYSRAITGKDDFVQLLKTSLNEQIGSELVGINAVHSIVDLAIERKHGGPITPLLLKTADAKFVVTLLTDLERISNKVFVVVTGKAGKSLKNVSNAVVLKDSTDESVEQALTNIRGFIRK